MTAAQQTSARPRLPSWRMTALRAALWMLVAAGPIGAAALWVQLDAIDSHLQVLAEQTGVPPEVDTTEVEGVAELAVIDFLTGSASSDSPTSTVVGTVSLGAVEVDTDYFAVTVATTTPAPESAAPVRFYLVGVVASGSDWAVVGPPALVTGPAITGDDETTVAMHGLDDTPGLVDAVEGFLAGYLAGEGDVTRYTAPGLAITGVTPPPFVAVGILEAGSIPHDEGRLVVATIEGTDPTGGVQILRYSMAMAEESGRWEVAGLLPVPPLKKVGSDD